VVPHQQRGASVLGGGQPVHETPYQRGVGIRLARGWRPCQRSWRPNPLPASRSILSSAVTLSDGTGAPLLVEAILGPYQRPGRTLVEAQNRDASAQPSQGHTRVDRSEWPTHRGSATGCGQDTTIQYR
jgi:hypothetical protein